VSQLAAVLKLSFRRSYPTVSKGELSALARRGRTQTEAAKELGVSQKRISSLASRYGVRFAPVWSRPRAAATELGRLLQRARLALGYSYARLGQLTGLHRRHIAAIEVGQVRRPTERTLRQLARSLRGQLSYDALARAAWGPDGRAPRANRQAKVQAKVTRSRDGSSKGTKRTKTTRAPARSTRTRTARGGRRR
jgi:transcriptional regulator with XRE-family HTH domain